MKKEKQAVLISEGVKIYTIPGLKERKPAIVVMLLATTFGIDSKGDGYRFTDEFIFN